MQNLDKWDQRFLRIAYEVASWSKDPGTKVGAVIVNDRRIIATGYNGFPQNIEDTVERYAIRETKLALTVHAEVNAILNAAAAGASTKDATLYVTFSPCVHCATSVIQAGIKKVVCPTVESAPTRWQESFRGGRLVLHEAGVQTVDFNPTTNV